MTLFEAYIDGQKIEKWHICTTGQKLYARILPTENDAWLHLFITRISDHKSLQDELRELDGKTVPLTQIPTLSAYRQPTLEISLQPDCLYDVLATKNKNGSRRLAGGGRLVTRADIVPYELTLDELKLLALEDLDVVLQQGNSLQAKVEYMEAFKRDWKLIIAGFNFSNASEEEYGVMINHVGCVNYYHGYSAQETKRFILQTPDATPKNRAS